MKISSNSHLFHDKNLNISEYILNLWVREITIHGICCSEENPTKDSRFEKI